MRRCPSLVRICPACFHVSRGLRQAMKRTETFGRAEEILVAQSAGGPVGGRRGFRPPAERDVSSAGLFVTAPCRYQTIGTKR